MYTRVFRFAPSPNGYLHLGHAFSALLNHDMARDVGGRLLLRIEDIDERRCRPDYEAAIYEDLAWLGISWQGPVRRQSEHFDDYAAALAKLGLYGLIFPSFESRSEIEALVAERERHGRWPRDPDGTPLYPGRARKISLAERERRRKAGEAYALRLAMDAAVTRGGVLQWTETGAGPQGQTGRITAAPQMWGDLVLARKDVPASYHLAVTVDDGLQGVSDVVRGQDLFWSTSVPPAAGAAWPAGAYLSPSSAHSRRRWPQALEIVAGQESAGASCRGRHAGGHQAHGGARTLNARLRSLSLFCSPHRHGMLPSWRDRSPNKRRRRLRPGLRGAGRGGAQRLPAPMISSLRLSPTISAPR